MPHIPDPPGGLRFCRLCDMYLPVEKFYTGRVRRFECRMHALERAKRYRRDRKGSDPAKMVVARVWHALYMDAKAIYNRRRAGLSQSDVRAMFWEMGVEPGLGWRVVPRDPTESGEWGLKDFVIVPREVRKRLVSEWLSRSASLCSKDQCETHCSATTGSS